MFFDLGRTADSHTDVLAEAEPGDRKRFWSHLYTGPWGFVDMGPFELSAGIGIGRVAREIRWCFLMLTVNTGLIWRTPVDFVGIHPLLGVSFDAVVWMRRECLRSPAVAPERPFTYFSSLKFMLGFGRDFAFCDNRFFRLRVLGHYATRFGNPDPFGGTLRVGFGRLLSG